MSGRNGSSELFFANSKRCMLEKIFSFLTTYLEEQTWLEQLRERYRQF